MKPTKAFAIAVTLLPLYGCASVSASLEGLFTPEPSMPLGVAKAAPDAKPLIDAPQNLEAALLEGQSARKNGDLNQAARVLSQLVLVAPDDARVVTEYGKTLAALGRSDDAVAFLERASQLAPADWSLYSALGVAYDQKGNYQAAQSYYDHALSLKPGDAGVLNNAALSHMQAGDLDGAEKLLHQVAPGTPDYPRIAQNLALLEKLKVAKAVKQEAASTPAPEAESAPSTAPAVASAAAPVVSAVPPPPEVAQTPAPALRPSTDVAMVGAPKQLITVGPLDAVPAQPSVKEPASVVVLRGEPALRSQPTPKLDATPARQEAVEKTAASNTVAVSTPAAKPASTPSTPAAPKAAVESVAVPKIPFAPVTPPTPAAKPAAPTHAAAVSGAYYVQAGAFFTPDRAEQSAMALDRLGARVMTGTSQGKPVFRVRIGPFRTAAQASTAKELAQGMGRTDLTIVSE